RLEKTTFADLPNKFEAGTPDIAGAVGLGEAIDYVCDIGLEAIAAHEENLANKLTEEVGAVGGVRIIGTAAKKAGICSFVVENPPAPRLGIHKRRRMNLRKFLSFSKIAISEINISLSLAKSSRRCRSISSSNPIAFTAA